MDAVKISDAQDDNINIFKCRDVLKPVYFKKVVLKASEGNTPKFKMESDSSCSWADADGCFGVEKLRPRIEPWLTALCQSEHLSLLIGSGLSQAVHRLATGKCLQGMSKADFGNENSVIEAEAKKSAEKMGRRSGNIEDQLRVANELMRGLEILGDKNSQKRLGALKTKFSEVIDTFANDVLNGERSLLTANERDNAYNYLVSFLMSFASRSGTRDRLHIFTTNYDRFIESGAEVAGLHLLDRFVGSLAPIFRSSRLDVDLHYNPPGIRGEPRYLEGVARFTKLHGSLDWIEFSDNIRRVGIPFGANKFDPFIDALGLQKSDMLKLMIYPNSAKDRETALFPYIELFRDFAAASCRPNHTLFSFGYSFGDDHINRVIEDMLTIPSTHLVIMSYGDPLGRIMKNYEKLGRPAQITLLIGDHIGGFKYLVDNYLPKPAIDKTTFRMAELLKSRWETEKNLSKGDNVAPSISEGIDP